MLQHVYFHANQTYFYIKSFSQGLKDLEMAYSNQDH